MGILTEGVPAETAPPRSDDGRINLQEPFRRLAEQAANEIMDAEADQLCGETGNSRNGHRERMLKTCVGELTPRVPKPRGGSFFPEDVIERHRRVDRALAAAVAGPRPGGPSTRKVRRVAERMGINRLGKGQARAPCASPGTDVEELVGRPLGDGEVPYV